MELRVPSATSSQSSDAVFHLPSIVLRCCWVERCITGTMVLLTKRIGKVRWAILHVPLRNLIAGLHTLGHTLNSKETNSFAYLCSISAFTRISKLRLQCPGGRRVELRSSVSVGGRVFPGSKVRGVPPASNSPLPPVPPSRRPTWRRPSCARCRR